MKSFLAACIIETRPITNLVEIISSHMEKLPDYTQLIIYHGQENSYLKEKFPSAICVQLYKELTINDYNNLLASSFLWEHLSTYNRVLIFQSDSMLLRKGIEEFMEWDYVGAPWKFQEHGGNGGLSLRNPSIMKQICYNNQYNLSYHGQEDVYFCNKMNELNMNLAPRDVCKKFSCESEFVLETLGYHAIERYMTEEQCQQIKNQYN